MSKRNFRLQTEDLANAVEQMYVASLRTALAKGIEAATAATNMDSGNAAFHWMVGVDGKSRPSSRKFGKPHDLRETRRGGVIEPLVKMRRSKIRNTALAAALVQGVLNRELTTIIQKHVKGQNPPLGFRLYNVFGDDVSKEGGYAVNADLNRAGQVGLEAIVKKFDEEIAKGNIRKYQRRR